MKGSGDILSVLHRHINGNKDKIRENVYFYIISFFVRQTRQVKSNVETKQTVFNPTTSPVGTLAIRVLYTVIWNMLMGDSHELKF